MKPPCSHLRSVELGRYRTQRPNQKGQDARGQSSPSTTHTDDCPSQIISPHRPSRLDLCEWDRDGRPAISELALSQLGHHQRRTASTAQPQQPPAQLATFAVHPSTATHPQTALPTPHDESAGRPGIVAANPAAPASPSTASPLGAATVPATASQGPHKEAKEARTGHGRSQRSLLLQRPTARSSSP